MVKNMGSGWGNRERGIGGKRSCGNMDEGTGGLSNVDKGGVGWVTK